MMGVMALWVGLMEIAQTSGLIKALTNGIQPFISLMFPKIPKGHIAREYISTNIIANVLGLGWACTPAGLKAMEALSGTVHADKFRLLPYSAVGIENSMLLALRADVKIDGETAPKTLVALSPTKVSDGGAYSALMGV